MFYHTFIDILPFFVLVEALFWLWMLYDCFVYERAKNNMILWLLVILFMNIIGALLYFFLRRSERLKIQ
jgi:RsiW-degrading membrane proteinase PrsW (M82 family)